MHFNKKNKSHKCKFKKEQNLPNEKFVLIQSKITGYDEQFLEKER